MMTLHRTTNALAALMLAGTLGGCAEYTTTGVPADETAVAQADLEAHSDSGGEEEAMTSGQDINELAGTLVGMPADEAEQAVTEAGFVWRVASVDGEPRALTMDYRTDRINAELVEDEVTRVTVG